MDFQATSKRSFELLWESVTSTNALTSNALSPMDVDANLETLGRLLAVFQEVVKTEIAKIRQQRNTSTPFFRLPTEIVVVVFELLVHEAEDRPKCIGALSTVSSTWNKIVNDTPSLWSHIQTYCRPEFVQKSLDKSANCAITVHGELSYPDVARQQAILATCGQLARWSSATLQSISHAGLGLLTYSRAPMLRKLEVTCSEQVSDGQLPVNLCDGHAPLLQHLSIFGFNIIWTSSLLSGLRTLSLRSMRGVELRQIANALRACPDLRSLIIIDIHFTGHLEIGSSSIELLSLTHLDVRNPSHDHSQHLLNNIHCPSAIIIGASIPYFAGNLLPQEVSTILQPLVSYAVKYLDRSPARGTETLPKLLFSQGRCSISYYRQGGIHSLWLDARGSARKIEAFLGRMHEAWPLPTSVLVINPALNGGWKVISRFRNTICLQLKDEAGSIKYLGTPFEQDGVAHWPFPTMKVLLLGAGVCETPEDVVKMVQSQKGRLLTSPDIPKELPESLGMLVIGAACPMDGLTFTKLKTILPGVKVTWEGEATSA